VELADCIKILDRYFEQQFGKGSNFYKQAWLPVKRASKPVELSTTAPNTTKVAICEDCKKPCGNLVAITDRHNYHDGYYCPTCIASME